MANAFQANGLRDLYNQGDIVDNFTTMLFDGQVLSLDVHEGGKFLLRQGRVLLAWTTDAHLAFRVFNNSCICTFGEFSDWVWQFKTDGVIPPLPIGRESF